MMSLCQRSQACAVLVLLALPAADTVAISQEATDSSSARTHEDSGRQLLEEGRLAEAERELLTALALDPSRSEILLDLARLHVRGRALPEAAQELEKYLRTHPDSVTALGLAGEVKFRGGDFKSAEGYLARTLQLKPGDGIAHKLLALCYGAENRWEDARLHLDRAVLLLPQDEETHYWRGRALFEGGHYREAIAEFEKTLEIRPEYLKAYDNLGLCYDRLSESAAAS